MIVIDGLEYLTTQEVAKRYSLSLTTVRALVRKGTLKPHQRPGQKENLFRVDEVAIQLIPKPK